MKTMFEKSQKLGVMLVGLGGAVATTAVAGIELLKAGVIGTEGLPMSQAPQELIAELPDYESLIFGGWDLSPADLSKAAATHNVLTLQQFQAVAPILSQIKPLPAVGNREYCANISCDHCVIAENHRDAIEILRQNIRDFQTENKTDALVLINLASTERFVDQTSAVYSSLKYFEQALDANAPEISPAMIYAYAAIAEAVPYGNFTPSVAADIPALVEFAKKMRVPIAGKDGKTGQTMMKTAVAPAFKTRALKVEGWYSTNILGNRDGLALSNPESLKSKVTTKGSVLDDILGYKVEDHLVDIRYYRPRGDNKEAWDNIDLIGFLGQQMQIKINFLCRDSILAAPLVIEIARLLDVAKRRGIGGVAEQLSVFFKLPQVGNPAAQPVHALHSQEQMLFEWLKSNQSAEVEKTGAEKNDNYIQPLNSNGNGANSSPTKVETFVASENGKH